jgi:hypothetical protein
MIFGGRLAVLRGGLPPPIACALRKLLPAAGTYRGVLADG